MEKQYKQIANAVSPQLAKFLCRSIIEAHLQAVSGKATVSNVTFSKELQTFRDFMLTFDESSLPKAKRSLLAYAAATGTCLCMAVGQGVWAQA